MTVSPHLYCRRSMGINIVLTRTRRVAASAFPLSTRSTQVFDVYKYNLNVLDSFKPMMYPMESTKQN